MPKGVNKDASNFREILEKSAIIVAGEEHDNNSIDVDSDEPVQVSIVFSVSGFGPHVAVICAGQGVHVDATLEVASEILEEWERDKYGEDISTETYDGQSWELDPEDFANAIEGTPAEKYFESIFENDEEEDD